MRTLIFAVFVALSLAGCGDEDTAPNGEPCCKHCDDSQACGDSCISSSYTCHQEPGCACE
jgi:hypothetical protein